MRILASPEDRLNEVMQRDGVGQREAEHILRKDDEERRRWGMKLYGIDTWDSRLYDMVLLIDQLTVDDAVELIFAAVNKPAFQTTEASQRTLNDQLLCARIHAMLVNASLMVEVRVEGAWSACATWARCSAPIACSGARSRR